MFQVVSIVANSLTVADILKGSSRINKKGEVHSAKHRNRASIQLLRRFFKEIETSASDLKDTNDQLIFDGYQNILRNIDIQLGHVLDELDDFTKPQVWNRVSKETEFLVTVGPIHPNRIYEFRFVLYSKIESKKQDEIKADLYDLFADVWTSVIDDDDTVSDEELNTLLDNLNEKIRKLLNSHHLVDSDNNIVDPVTLQIPSFRRFINEYDNAKTGPKDAKDNITRRIGSILEPNSPYDLYTDVPNQTSIPEIELLRAHADHIACQTDKAVIKTTTNAMLKAILSRDDGRGSVSDGTEVLFKATQQNDKSIGFLSSESTTTTNGLASVMFTANTGDVILDQPVTITMSTKKDSGEIEICTLILRVEE